MVQVRSGHLSITGNFRENNEDNYCIDKEGRYFIVADGMGGQSAGERASELAVELVPKKLEELLDFDDDPPEKVQKSIDESVGHANSEIMALGEVDPSAHNMGTTIAMIVSIADEFYVGNVGDSRVYQLRDDQFDQLTTDHSLIQALIDAGTITPEEATTHRYKNVLYRYLGAKEGGNGADAQAIQPVPGDRYIICSDGVTDGIDGDDLKNVLKSHDEPQAAAEAIVDAALEGGSRDNITCVVLYIDE